MSSRKMFSWVLVAGLAAVAVNSAHAANLLLTDEVTYPGPTSPGVTVTTTGLTNAPITPGATFGLSNTLAGGLQNFPAGFVSGSGGPWNFYDDYVFTVTGATVDAAIISIPLGSFSVNSLQARIFSMAGNSLPTLAGLAPGTLLVDAWTNASCGIANCVITLPTNFAPGTYDLQIRGAAGVSGGSYGGNINFAPVPLPAALPLLLSGMGLFGGLMRRRSKST
jgi:hypothetical protein